MKEDGSTRDEGVPFVEKVMGGILEEMFSELAGGGGGPGIFLSV